MYDNWPTKKISKLIELSLSVQGITLQSAETHRLLGVHLDQESDLEYPY